MVKSPTPSRSSIRAAKGYQQLLDWGVEIYEYQPTMMHVKAMMVDDVWSVFGSANFDNRSFELNDELSPPPKPPAAGLDPHPSPPPHFLISPFNFW